MLKLFALLFGLLKLGKLGGTVITMLVSLAVYTGIFGWRYAAGFIALLMIHEMGHFIAARQRGLAVSTPTFIPFVGAWIQLKEQPMNAETEAYVGFAGPLIGTVGALVCYFLARHYDNSLLLALSYSGFFINLFNLIPISPFDGGRITSVLSPRIWFFGVPILLAMFLWRPSPMLIVVALLAVPQLGRAIRYNPNLPENSAYYGTSTETKVTYGLYYLALAAFLAVMSYDVHQMLGPAAQ